jgi:hypothetical protein
MLKREDKVYFEMSNIRPSDTGLSMIIWVSVGKNAGKQLNHFFRIKVQKNYSDNFMPSELFTITYDKKIIGDIGEIKQKDIERIFEFMDLNENTLIDFWNGLLSAKELLNLLIPIK